MDVKRKEGRKEALVSSPFESKIELRIHFP